MLLENNPYPKDSRVRSEAESLARAGHRVTVIAPRGTSQARIERIAGVDVRRFRLIDGAGRGAAGFIAEFLIAGVVLNFAAMRALARGATVLHIHNPPDLFFPAGAAFRVAGRKVVFDHHDLFPETIKVKFRSSLLVSLARICQRLTFAVANHVIATNTSYADVALHAGGKAPENVTIVRNAPPSAWTRLQAQHRDGALRAPRLAYLGAISAQDGVEGLVPVLARLRGDSRTPGPHLTIIGDGDERPALERAFAQAGLADCVTFTGWVPRDRVPELLQDADVCVDPSPQTDVNDRSTMIKVAEYLAFGKPVVAYDLLETGRTAAGAAILVRPGDDGAFVDAVARLAAEPDLRSELIGKARARAADLTWEHSERALLSAYDGLRRPKRAGDSSA